MDRRNLLAGAGLLAVTAAQAQAQTKAPPASGTFVVLHCDLIVDPRREQEMLDHFHKVFKPAGETFKGYIDVRMLKYRTHIQGPELQKGVNYRFELLYESEALRQKWVNSATHQRVWKGIGDTMLNPADFQVVLFDNA